MRKKEREITDISVMNGIIKRAKVIRLGLCDGPQPYVIPLNFGYEDNIFYFHCASEGRKLTVMKENPLVCIEVEGDMAILPDPKGKACAWSATYESIIAFGSAEILTEVSEKRKGLAIIMKQYSDEQFEFGENSIKGVTVVRVAVKQMTGKSSKE
jgi:uncharacterized protein